MPEYWVFECEQCKEEVKINLAQLPQGARPLPPDTWVLFVFTQIVQVPQSGKRSIPLNFCSVAHLVKWLEANALT